MIIRNLSKMTIKDGPLSRGISLDELLYFVGLILWVAQTYMFRSFYGDFFGGMIVKGIRWLAVLLFVAKIFHSERRITLKLLVLACITGAVVLTVGRNGAAGTTLLYLFILLIAAKNVDFKKTCRVMAWTCLACFTTVVLTDALGFMHYDPMIELKRSREYMGFVYVSFPAIYFNNFVFCFLYGYTEQNVQERKQYRRGAMTEVPWWLLGVLTAAEYWVYKKCDTALAFGIGIIFIFLYVLTVKLKINVFSRNLLAKVVSLTMFPGFALFTYELCKRYKPDSEFWDMLDGFSHNRIRMTYMGIKNYGLNFFGTVIVQNTDTTKGEYFYIDSGYMKNMMNYGLVFLALLLGMYTMMFYAAIKEQDTVLAIWMFCAAVYSVYNNFMISPVENASFMAMWYGLYLLHRSDHKKVRYRRIRKIESSTES